MLKRLSFMPVPILAGAAIALSGCGGSSTPAGTSGGAAGTGTGISHAGLTPSSPVSSAAAMKFLIQEGQRGGLTLSQSQSYIACLEKKLAAEGIKTFAQVHAKLASLVPARDACIAQAKKG